LKLIIKKEIKRMKEVNRINKGMIKGMMMEIKKDSIE
jgi:hypothetical protein